MMENEQRKIAISVYFVYEKRFRISVILKNFV